MTSAVPTDPAQYDPVMQMVVELDWLKNHPEFAERPASIIEFLGPKYLDIEAGVRPGLKKMLVEIFGEKTNPYRLAQCKEAMFTGAIGVGKTTFASIVLPYMAHWVLCLKNPQKFFGLLPGSRIAFMQMSTSEDQAKEVIFGDIVARISHSPWFKLHPHNDRIKNQIRWEDENIWIVPGDSAETTFEGYNILGGILDEMDSHRITPKRDYAEAGYNTISNRISSRFGDRGLFILIGQMKQETGFAMRHFKRMLEDPDCYTMRMTLWESFGWEKYLNPDGTRNSFWFDTRRKIQVPLLVAQTIANPDLLEIPNLYKKQFVSDPDKALRDLAGIPPKVGTPFIGMQDLLDAPPELWVARHKGIGTTPVIGTLDRPQFEPWFRAPDRLPRAIHIDLSYSGLGENALGFAMGHVRELKEVDGDLLPYIVFDFVLRIKPTPGRQIILSDVRQMVYHLRDDLGFKIKMVTLDGFESTDTIQMLSKRRINSGYLSVDRDKLPYQDLRDAIYEQRIEWPRYMVQMEHIDVRKVDIVYQELSQLIDDGKKIDHPPGGSKDVSDAMAGVTTTLMGDRSFKRGVPSMRKGVQPQPSADDGLTVLEPVIMRAPIPDVELLGISTGYGGPISPGVGGRPGMGDIYEGTGIVRPEQRWGPGASRSG